MENGPLLDVVGSGCCLGIHPADPLFDGLVDSAVLRAHDLRHRGGLAAHLLAELYGLFCQLVRRLCRVWVQSALGRAGTQTTVHLRTRTLSARSTCAGGRGCLTPEIPLGTLPQC